MKLSISREALRLGLEAVTGAVPSRTTLPVLQSVHMEAEGSLLTLRATDLDTTAISSVACEVEEPGAICGAAKRLLDIAKAAAGTAPINLTASGSTLKVKAGRASYSLPALEGEEFPDPPKLPYGADHVVRAADLWRLLAQVGFCASSEETRPILNGALWQIRDGEMQMVATNGHRMARMAMPVAVPAGVGVEENDVTEAIVRPRGLDIGRALFDDEEELEVSFSENHVSIRGGQTLLISRLIEGPYPNYEQVIPDNADKVLIVHRDSLIQTLRRVAIMASDQTNRIRWSLKEGGLTISAATPDTGDASDEVAGEYTGEPLEIGFNAKYLLDMLPKLPTDTVRFSFTSAERAATIHPVGDDAPDILNLLMPLRLLD